MSSEELVEQERIIHEIECFQDACQFEIDRLDFDYKRIKINSYRSRLDTIGGFACTAIFSALIVRIWPGLRPIDSILYRNRFLVPKLPDWIAKLTNVYPSMYCLTAGYSLFTGTAAARDWKKSYEDMLSISIRIDEKRGLVSNLNKRFATAKSEKSRTLENS